MNLRRRSFLKSAAAAFPAAALTGLAATAPALQPSSAVHPVAAGRDRSGHLHSLGFSSLAFKVTTADSGGNLFVIEHTNLMPGAGPALHLHYAQDEWFYVLAGAVVFQVGDRRVQLDAGESVLGPRRVPHTFSAQHSPAHLLIAFAPAGKMEQYFTDSCAHPSLAATADFMNRYEMQWVGPSPFWKA